MTAALSEDYVYFLEKFGQADAAVPVPDGFRASLDKHLPADFLDFVETTGLGMWLGGYFQFCDPREYVPIVDKIFSNDKDFPGSSTHMLGFSAFGTALLWNEEHRALDLDFLNGVLTASSFFTPPMAANNVSLGIAVTSIDLESYDAFADDGKPMFKRLARQHGRLPLGQIFAPKVHPAMGGALNPVNFRPVNALVAMSLMADAVGRFRLVDARKFPPMDVRLIGR